MSRLPLLPRLCNLIDKCLRQYTDTVRVSLTKEEEKIVLIALSQVLREVQLWTTEINSDLQTVHTLAKTVGNSTVSTSHSGNHECLTAILCDLIILLASGNLYIQHLAGNILVCIFELMVTFESGWEKFVHLLCICLEFTFSILSPTMVCLTTESKDSDSEPPSFIIDLKRRLNHVSWSFVAEIIRALRCILKCLKQESDIRFLKVYLDTITSCLSRMPWDLLNEILVGQKGEELGVSNGNAFLHVKSLQSLSRIKFYGNLLQLLCSLVEQFGLVDVRAVPPDKLPVFYKINNLIPQLFIWCLGEKGYDGSMFVSQYFKHKLMMLLIRLSFHIPLEFSVVNSWLHLIQKHFQDLLLQPITPFESDLDDHLEGSPLWLSFFDPEKQWKSSRHLQRLVLFFFLRCSFSLVNMTKTIGDQSVCSCSNLYSTVDPKLDIKCSHRNKGLLELNEWLQHHLPADFFVDHDMYYERCVDFTSSFLQLYMQEDDILFKMLLQLFCIPLRARQRVCTERCTSQALNNNTHLVQDIFNPIHLFHLFLAELHYDHQVLLDYLISKDMGASFAEYLLRSLRAVCDTWNVFVEFSGVREVVNRPASRKRKILEDDLGFQEKLLPASLESCGICPSLDKEHERKYMCGRNSRTGKIILEGGIDCLLSLKKSVENLHQKKLFPYNPEALLQRLTRFEELCLKQ